MAYKFVLTKQAAGDLRNMDRTTARRIIKKLMWFQKQANPLLFAKRLREPAAGDIRFRVGDIRLIALINEKQKRIEIVRIGHRRDVYLS